MRRVWFHPVLFRPMPFYLTLFPAVAATVRMRAIASVC